MQSNTEKIKNTDRAICRYLDRIDTDNRGVVSQDILGRLSDLVEHIMLGIFSENEYVDDTEENIEKATQYTQTHHKLKELYRFHYFLENIMAQYILDEDNSERLMLKYYKYLIDIKKLAKNYLGLDVLP